MSILAQVKAARRVSAPILAINTPDPAATIAEIVNGVNGKSAAWSWDFMRGILPANPSARDAARAFDAEATIGNPPGLMMEAEKLEENSILFVHSAQRYMEDVGFLQGLWNLRDQFKQNRRTLILLSPQVSLPPELAPDAVVLDEPLPNRQEIAEIVQDVHRAGGLECPAETLQKAVDATQGLSAFQVEQTVAMSLTPDGLVLSDLWERKRKQIEQTPGLKVCREDVSFDDVGGCQQIKDFMTAILGGRRAPKSVVFVDEIEKALAGAAGDTSGVTQDQLGVLLSYMQDNQSVGTIFVGPPGAAKSMVAKAVGGEAGIPTVQLDLGAAKGSLVGQSERTVRDALKVITAVSGGDALWIATCNSISELPPELRRRFTLGTFFFDLPDADERTLIWGLYLEKYGIREQYDARVNDTGWTGAEIKQCCDIAWRTGLSLEDAAAFVVPVSISAASRIDGLRKMSDGRFLSASKRGIYRYNAQSGDTARKISFE